MFLVLGLPRSRTFWLSKSLSYGDFECGHEEARYLRSLDDAKIWLTQEFRGSAETSVAPFWRLIHKANPNLRVVVIRRPVAEVIASTMALNMAGVGAFDPEKLSRAMFHFDAKLMQIERRMPNVLSVKFSDLDNEETARAVFEHCLPYPFDPAWWNSLRNVNLQCNMRAMTRYSIAYRDSIERMRKIAAYAGRAQILATAPKEHGGVTIQQEPVDDWLRDGVPLFEAHCVEVGDAPDEWKRKNIPLLRDLYKAGALQITTARCNGRMFGYLAAVINPSLEAAHRMAGLHTTFYVSKEMPGLSIKLQRASVAALKEKGAREVIFHEGTRGDGPRMGVLYQRLGAEDFGRLHRLDLGGVQ